MIIVDPAAIVQQKIPVNKSVQSSSVYVIPRRLIEYNFSRWQFHRRNRTSAPHMFINFVIYVLQATGAVWGYFTCNLFVKIELVSNRRRKRARAVGDLQARLLELSILIQHAEWYVFGRRYMDEAGRGLIEGDALTTRNESGFYDECGNLANIKREKSTALMKQWIHYFTRLLPLNRFIDMVF